MVVVESSGRLTRVHLEPLVGASTVAKEHGAFSRPHTLREAGGERERERGCRYQLGVSGMEQWRCERPRAPVQTWPSMTVYEEGDAAAAAASVVAAAAGAAAVPPLPPLAALLAMLAVCARGLVARAGVQQRCSLAARKMWGSAADRSGTPSTRPALSIRRGRYLRWGDPLGSPGLVRFRCCFIPASCRSAGPSSTADLCCGLIDIRQLHIHFAL